MNMKISFPKWSALFFAGLFIVFGCHNQICVVTGDVKRQAGEKSSNIAKPNPDHIVILILENHEYFQVFGSPEAPYINALAKDSMSSLFTRSYIIEHPSQPNYLNLFSGSNQGVDDDYHPRKEPFNTPNLGRQLIDAGKSFATYSEDLPAIGFNGEMHRAYVRKHNPSANWMGEGKNQIPQNTNLPFSEFPSDYAKLPTVSFVVPNQVNDMHDASVGVGDAWVKKNLDGYIQWAKTHNSLFILTFDEDDYGGSGHILTIFTGAMVKGGINKMTINHFNVLRTIEWMYGLPYAGRAAKVKTIDNCWK
jgi:acid phosphatase